ncbi:MAG: tail fiber protein, partial [Bacteroidota bacterium]
IKISKMKKSTSKNVILSMMTLAVSGMGVSLVSSTTKDHSNTQILKELAIELNAVSEELAELKAAKEESNLYSEPYLGEIILFAGNFAPRGWAFCDGQLLPIAQNTALFSLLGTTYGGDGRTTFALPDLRGRVAVHPGAGPGLSRWQLGQKMGVESTMLNTNNMPSHAHDIIADLPTHNFEESGEMLLPGNTALLGVANAVNGTVHEEFNTRNTGSGQPFSITQPSLGVNYIIATNGLFPSRS